MRIMVVDDSTAVRQRILAQLKRVESVEALLGVGSGEEALEQMDAFGPDLLTLDLTLPGVSGLHVLVAAKKRTPPPVVIVFTNYPYPAFRRRCLELGAEYFLGKSTDLERILEIVRSHSGPHPFPRPDGESAPPQLP